MIFFPFFLILDIVFSQLGGGANCDPDDDVCINNSSAITTIDGLSYSDLFPIFSNLFILSLLILIPLGFSIVIFLLLKRRKGKQKTNKKQTNNK